MFIKYLKITKGSSIIRNIEFRKGINLIVDESKGRITGNSVGIISYAFNSKVFI